MRHVERTALAGAEITSIAGEIITILPQRAIWWQRQHTLFLADLHLGKAATFRSAGIPVPESTTTRNLALLTSLIGNTRAERLVILGDFYHARAGRSADVESALIAWRTQHASLDILLVRGNHDRASGDPDTALNITCLPEGSQLEPFTLNHHPAPPEPGAYSLAGHIHPAYRLIDRATNCSHRFPCFLIDSHTAILPAFGAFTGMKITEPPQSARIFIIAEGQIIRVR